MSPTPNIFDEVGIAASNLAQSATGLVTPTMRLGVTGLSRAGKTVFITSLIDNILNHERLVGLKPVAEGRFLGAQLVEHPDRSMPRFGYETHLKALKSDKPTWPQSTRQISQLRIALKFQSQNWINALSGPSILNIDLIDYPGEWLLDLPLLDLSFEEWSAKALALPTQIAPNNKMDPGGDFAALLAKLDTSTTADEALAEQLSQAYKKQVLGTADSAIRYAALPPGRFLNPGDLEGAPALTFAPLPMELHANKRDSFYQLMVRRYQAYQHTVIRPFFNDHFARLDRQIVLVDALRALNQGAQAIGDLSSALQSVLSAFRQGKNSPLHWLLARRIDKILFAATKADLVHNQSHDQLTDILDTLVKSAAAKARFSGAATKSMAVAGVRSTNQGTIEENGEEMPCLIGTPQKGEQLGDETYDGQTEIALFPGDLPKNPESIFHENFEAGQLNFLRFNPPKPDDNGSLPYIRMDQALNYLLEDWLQ